ncbi:MAG TPA: hypothetical protein VHA52_13040 [Candidatus Babeliaceae bacterium]|nr:hypothetical protein [Candidatus Babeliaceae bacterium]
MKKINYLLLSFNVLLFGLSSLAQDQQTNSLNLAEKSKLKLEQSLWERFLELTQGPYLSNANSRYSEVASNIYNASKSLNLESLKSIDINEFTQASLEKIQEILKSMYDLASSSWNHLEQWQKTQVIFVLIAIAGALAINYIGSSYILYRILSTLGLAETAIAQQFKELTRGGVRVPMQVLTYHMDKLAFLGGYTVQESAVKAAVAFLLGVLTLLPTLQQYASHPINQLSNYFNQLKSYIWPNQESTMAQPDL